MMNNSFQGLPISEVVPEAIPAMGEGMSKSSLLVSRRKIRFQPQTGTAVGNFSAGTGAGGSIVQFVLADSSSLLDVNSATISFTVKTSGTGTETLDDGAALFRRMQVSLNGNLVEDIDHCHRLSNMEVYASADKSWYQSAGSYAGYWKLNPDLVIGNPVATTAALAGATWGAATGAANSTVLGNLLQGYNPGFGDIGAQVVGTPTGPWAAAGVRTAAAAGETRVVPLSILSGFFRTKQYIPLNLLGELVISFTLAQAAEAIFQATGAVDGDYAIQDCFMECDVVQPHYALQELMTKVATSEGESGIVIPYESAIVSQGQIITSGSSSVIVSRATNNLRRLLYAHQLTAALSSANFPSVSCFGFNACTGWQVRVGSYYFPSQPASTPARMFGLLQGTYGEAVNEKPGLINRNLYEQTTAANGTGGNLRNAFADAFIVGYNFDSYKNTSGTNVLDADGLSVLGQAGSQVVIQVDQTGSVTPVVALIATRYLSLMNGTLRIIGV
jgi:hypothetical protein